jgi:hypothetical protein
MLRKMISLIAIVVGVSNGSPQEIQAIDPNKLLFSAPTLSNEIAETEPVSSQPGKDVLVFHEDDWCQVEFIKKSQLPEIKKTLSEYKIFEAKNRTGNGWKNVYVRDMKKEIVVPGKQSVTQIATLLRAKQGEMVYLASTEGFGNVKNGFTVPLGGNISLYGTIGEAGVTVLAADVGQNPETSRLADAFVSLNRAYGLVLVDWKSQTVLLSKNKSGKIEIWKP